MSAVLEHHDLDLGDRACDALAALERVQLRLCVRPNVPVTKAQADTLHAAAIILAGLIDGCMA